MAGPLHVGCGGPAFFYWGWAKLHEGRDRG